MADLDAVLELARQSGTGLTNLPPDRDALSHRIAAAVRAIEDDKERAGGAAIMLVAELNGQIAATA